LAKYVLAALVNVPSWMPCVLSVMLKVVSEAMVSRLVGLWNLDDGMSFTEGMFPIGMGLQEPVVICRPLVMVWPAQKFMKLFVEMAAGLWPVTGGFWPSSVVWITEASRVKDDWSPLEDAGGGAVAKTVDDEVAALLVSVVEPVEPEEPDDLEEEEPELDPDDLEDEEPELEPEDFEDEPELDEEPDDVEAEEPEPLLEVEEPDDFEEEEPEPVLEVEDPELDEEPDDFEEEEPEPVLEEDPDDFEEEEPELDEEPDDLDEEEPDEEPELTEVEVEPEAVTVRVTVETAPQVVAATAGAAGAVAMRTSELVALAAAAEPPKVKSSKPVAEAAPLQLVWSTRLLVTVKQVALFELWGIRA
jgi:hypothetical protein